MSRRPCWHDAIRASEELTSGDRRTLSLLTRVPFAWAELLRQLSGLGTTRSIYLSFNRLRAAGLMDAYALPSRPTCSPNLAYLTDLGLATVALACGASPQEMARRYQLRRSDLLRRLVGLPPLLASYELLGLLAASVPGTPVLHAWEYPWRVTVQSRTVEWVRATSTAAYAAFSWEGHERTAAHFLLIADTASRPMASYRADIHLLMRLRDVRPGDVPTLIIATSCKHRVIDWHHYLIEVAKTRHDSPPDTHIATWEQLRDGVPIPIDTHSMPRMEVLGSPMKLPPWSRGPAHQSVPRLVGGSLFVLMGANRLLRKRDQCALRLSDRDRCVLDLIGRHPYLTSEEVATILSWEKGATRERTDHLLARATMRTLLSSEIDGRTMKRGLLELTRDGVEIVAAQAGLPPWLARRYFGVTGFGVDCPLGPREDLLRNLEHTLGVNDCFVDLYRAAAASAKRHELSGMMAWHNAAVCGTPYVRPDGYGLYQCRGIVYGFFLEYDRGTMSTRDLIKKFTRYQTYKESRQYERHYDEFPVVLVVTTTSIAEDRVFGALQTAGQASGATLAVLLSTVERLNAEPLGTLGPVWRDSATVVRRSWLWNDDGWHSSNGQEVGA